MNNFFENKLQVNGVDFCYSRKKDVDEKEMHAYNELLFYLDGKATFRTETLKQKLAKNTLILIPKGKYHSFLLDSPEDFTRLKISFTDEVFSSFNSQLTLSEIKLFLQISPLSLGLLSQILSVLCRKDCNGDMFVYGAFLSILFETLCDNSNFVSIQKTNQLITECTAFVENNLSSNLSLENLGKELGFSPSTISHTFKKELGTSFHNYVVQKRMIFAKTLLDKGLSATETCLMVGYNNYSSFYKACVNFYKTSPKNK